MGRQYSALGAVFLINNEDGGSTSHPHFDDDPNQFAFSLRATYNNDSKNEKWETYPLIVEGSGSKLRVREGEKVKTWTGKKPDTGYYHWYPEVW